MKFPVVIARGLTTQLMTEQTNYWNSCLDEYRNGRWRAPIFCDMVLSDLQRFNSQRTVLDIGCGKGFDNEPKLQEAIAKEARSYIGIEPDPELAFPDWFAVKQRCPFEECAIAPASVDLAYAAFVLEHILAPDVFFGTLLRALKPGGVFWAFTIDRRSCFAAISRIMEIAGIKTWYLDKVRGRRGEERYGNYPTYYRANSPDQIDQYTTSFRGRVYMNWQRVGQNDDYFPRLLRPLARVVDRITMGANLPGTLLIVRLEK